jgi:hypothetical protein
MKVYASFFLFAVCHVCAAAQNYTGLCDTVSTVTPIGIEARYSIISKKISASSQLAPSPVAHSFLSATLYTSAYPGVRGHHFFGKIPWQQGRLLYKGSWKEVQALQFDCAAQTMVAALYTAQGVVYLSLIAAEYPEIILGGQQFIYRHSSEADMQRGIASGYYYLLSGGQPKIYARQIKTAVSKVGITEFETRNEFYALAADGMQPIRRLSNFAEIMPEKFQEIENYAASRGISKLAPLSLEDISDILNFANTPK